MFRPAGQALKWLFKGSGPGDIALRVIPDAGFGILEAVNTPGDIVDKTVAGLGSATGGVLGGAALGKLGGNNQAVANLLDMGGSIGGDMLGRSGAEAIQRGKDSLMGGQGLSAYERSGVEYEEALKQQMREQVFAELGMAVPTVDPTMVQLGQVA